jgi:phosphohistidine phosphatase SixA
VYSTDYNRTKQTAQPTAAKNNLEISIYDPSNLDGPLFIESNKGKTVLVVGHSNTTPSFVNAVINEEKYDSIDDLNNGKLFMVSIIDGTAKTTVLQIN